jgi:hypothetical protein
MPTEITSCALAFSAATPKPSSAHKATINVVIRMSVIPHGCITTQAQLADLLHKEFLDAQIFSNRGPAIRAKFQVSQK